MPRLIHGQRLSFLPAILPRSCAQLPAVNQSSCLCSSRCRLLIGVGGVGPTIKRYLAGFLLQPSLTPAPSPLSPLDPSLSSLPQAAAPDPWRRLTSGGGSGATTPWQWQDRRGSGRPLPSLPATATRALGAGSSPHGRLLGASRAPRRGRAGCAPPRPSEASASVKASSCRTQALATSAPREPSSSRRRGCR